MTNLNPKPDTSLAPLENLFWDYNYSLTGKDLYDFVLEKKEIPFLDRDQVKARMLMTVGWYRLIDIFGLTNLRLLLTDDTLKWVWVDELREQYALAGKTIARVLQLEDKGYYVSTYGFSQNFARFSLTGPSGFSGLQLKADFIRPREGSHSGDFKFTSLFSRIDNPKNILTEKLSYIHKKFPKDIADIWVICRNLSFHWEEAIAEAARKQTTDPLFTAEILSRFPSHELEKVSWITPIRVEDFERDREIIVKNIITKEFNQLAD